MQQACNRAAGQSRFCGIRPAGQDDRNAGTEYDSGKLGTAEVFEVLGKHVSAV